MRTALTAAAAQPVCIPRDIDANAGAHANAIRGSRAQLIVFPELSLTGYELDVDAINPGDAALAPIIDACAEATATALVGVPVRDESGTYIATLAVAGDGARIAYCKTFLGGGEARVFAPGRGPASIVVSGWRVGLGICKDTRMPGHVDGTIALGIDVYVAGLVHHPHELEDQDARAARIIERGRVPVVFASAAGIAGGEFRIGAGHSCIWAKDGRVLARATAEPGQIAVATLTG